MPSTLSLTGPQLREKQGLNISAIRKWTWSPWCRPSVVFLQPVSPSDLIWTDNHNTLRGVLTCGSPQTARWVHVDTLTATQRVTGARSFRWNQQIESVRKPISFAGRGCVCPPPRPIPVNAWRPRQWTGAGGGAVCCHRWGRAEVVGPAGGTSGVQNGAPSWPSGHVYMLL